jgi:hypothetical protein
MARIDPADALAAGGLLARFNDVINRRDLDMSRSLWTPDVA